MSSRDMHRPVGVSYFLKLIESSEYLRAYYPFGISGRSGRSQRSTGEPGKVCDVKTAYSYSSHSSAEWRCNRRHCGVGELPPICQLAAVGISV